MHYAYGVYILLPNELLRYAPERYMQVVYCPKILLYI